MNTKDILQAIQQKIITVVAASSMPTMPIKFVDVPWNPPGDGRYLEVIFLPNNPSDQTWGDEEYHRGLFRILLHWQNKGSGSYTPLDYISNIGKGFPKGERIGSVVKVLNKAKVNPPVEGEIETLYPVTIEYDTFFLE